MATFRLRRFSCPEILKAIEPERLLQFLQPYQACFASRSLTLPAPGKAKELDYQALVDIFMSPDATTPKDLIDALYFVEEMSTLEAMDSLLPAAAEADLTLDDEEKQTPADVAIQVWLLDRDLIERKHAEQFLCKPRSFEYYQTDQSPVPSFTPPTDATLQALQQSLDEWFLEKRRGAGSRVFAYPKEDGVWFLVRHGEPFKREESLDGAEASSVCYRPLKYDVLVYHPQIGELSVNARSKGEKELYRTQFGRFLLGSKNFFPGTAKYTLEPLREFGADSLSCFDVEGIEWIRLKEIHYFWGGGFKEIEIRKADDLFAALEARGGSVPESAHIIRAVFQVKFEDSKTPRSVTIRPSNIAQYTRDGDAAHLEDWLAKRGFILSQASEEHEPSEPPVAIA